MENACTDLVPLNVYMATSHSLTVKLTYLPLQ